MQSRLFAWAQDAPRLRAMQLPAGATANNATRDVDAPRVYIVQLQTPSAAEMHASTVTRFRGKPAIGQFRVAQRFDKLSADIQDHVRRLDAEQSNVLQKAGISVQEIYRYRYSLNGFAALMTETDASKLRDLPEVVNVWEDEVRRLSTNSSPAFLGLFDADVGLRGAPGLDGDGVVIGIIDSGVYPEHPALQDTREADRPRACQSAWAENSLLGQWLCRRYDKLDDVQVFDPPENWNGACETGPQFTLENCNNKLIGARFFLGRCTGIWRH